MTESKRGLISIDTGPAKGKTTGAKLTLLLVEMPDTVTEMREVKHAYRKGVLTRRGIEY
jgi:ATP:corrinoid adenosyltransferase